MQPSRRDLPDLLRSVGGLLFAAGALALLVRKSGDHGWSDFARLLVVLVPAVTLYLLALQAPREDPARPWQSVLLVTSILLIPAALFEFLHWVGASTRHLLYDAGVFALTAMLAGYGARRARVSYAALLAALAALVAWLFLWGKILNHPSADTFRWLLVASAALLLLVAARMIRAAAVGAGEVATTGGVAAVAAGILGVIVGGFVALARVFTSGLSSGLRHPSSPIVHRASFSTPRLSPEEAPSHRFEPLTTPSGVHIHTSGVQHLGWDVYLLIASLALVWIGARMRVRGLGYVGGVGLLALIISVGVQITRLQAGHAPTHALLDWPLILVLAGVVALLASSLRSREP